MGKLESFIEEHRITEVECLVPDMNGIARGKILPDEKFLKGLDNRGLLIRHALRNAAVPIVTVIGRSVFLRIVRQGIPR